MNPGKLRHRVTLQEKQTGDNGIGGTIIEWVDFANVWASIEPLQGRELLMAQQVNPELDTRVRIRYRDGIGSHMRVVHKSRIYELEGPPINPEERNIELELMCKESGIYDG